jgi:hypothetical protein
MALSPFSLRRRRRGGSGLYIRDATSAGAIECRASSLIAIIASATDDLDTHLPALASATMRS